MAASLKDKRTPITTPPYQVPSVDVTPDPPIFSLVTTFKRSGLVWHFGPPSPSHIGKSRAFYAACMTQSVNAQCALHIQAFID